MWKGYLGFLGTQLGPINMGIIDAKWHTDGCGIANMLQKI